MATPVPPSLLFGASYEATQKTLADLVLALWKQAPEVLKIQLEGWWKNITDFFAFGDEKHWKTMLENFRKAGLLRTEDINNLASIGQQSPWGRALLFLNIYTRFFSIYIDAFINPLVEKVTQQSNKLTRPALPSGSEAINAAFIAPEKTAQVRDILARLGYTDDDIDLLFLARYRLYDDLTVRELWWRQILPDDKMYERMRELGYTDTRIKEITQAWNVIPPIQDILTMVAHEAFEPDSIKKMGLDAEFPEEQSEYLSKQGLSPYWQMKYWISHWYQPSIQMGYEMLQRGIINREDLEFLFRTVEIPAYWRDKLLKIAYNPFTRVDTRRMYALGVLSEDDLIRCYKDIGYDDWHAQKLMEFTKRNAMGAERDLSKSEVLTGYREKLIPRSDAERMLKSMKYDENEVSYILNMVDYKEKKALQDDLVAAVQTRYKNGLIHKDEAQRLLDGMGLPSDFVQAKLERWSASIIDEYKLPSKTDLDKFLAYGIINSDIYRAEMRKLGYSYQYITWYEKLAKTKGGIE